MLKEIKINPSSLFGPGCDCQFKLPVLKAFLHRLELNIVVKPKVPNANINTHDVISRATIMVNNSICDNTWKNLIKNWYALNRLPFPQWHFDESQNIMTVKIAIPFWFDFQFHCDSTIKALPVDPNECVKVYLTNDLDSKMCEVVDAFLIAHTSDTNANTGVGMLSRPCFVNGVFSSGNLYTSEFNCQLVWVPSKIKYLMINTTKAHNNLKSIQIVDDNKQVLLDKTAAEIEKEMQTYYSIDADEMYYLDTELRGDKQVFCTISLNFEKPRSQIELFYGTRRTLIKEALRFE